MSRTIILDVPHGSNVSGKRSPDSSIIEYEYGRMFSQFIKDALIDEGINAIIPVTETIEIGLRNRVARYNKINDAIVMSNHLNASGNGKQWMSARGFEIWTSKGETDSDRMATIVFEQVEEDFPEMKVRPNTWDKNEHSIDPDWEANFIVLLSKHPSMLIEYGFQDNILDVKMLLDENWQDKMVASIVKSVKQF